jgi:D-alanine-D-alanine ligase
MSRKLRVGLVFGGRSGEHEISLLSARSIFDALDRERYEPVLLGIDHDGRWHLQEAAKALLSAPGTPLVLDTSASSLAVSPGSETNDSTLVTVNSGTANVASLDVIFPVLHGTYGEDGTLQGLMEMAGLPYVGSGVLGSAAGMDKDIAKRLFRSAGIPVVDGMVVRASDPRNVTDIAREVRERFGYPCFVKPCNMGSSVGVSKARDDVQLAEALRTAWLYDTKVLIERGHNVREIEVAVLGNDHPEASVAGEIIPTHDFYSYEAKYLDENGAHLKIPAEIDEAQMNLVRTLAMDAFKALDLQGLARVDFFLDKDTGRFYLNEVNTMPGFTRISMYPKLWEASGIGYSKLVDRLIGLALERHTIRRSLSTRYVSSKG